MGNHVGCAVRVDLHLAHRQPATDAEQAHGGH